ncbi:MAG: protease pro-enzyme activation domain-containing protein [Dehalococcoidia bacterium]
MTRSRIQTIRLVLLALSVLLLGAAPWQLPRALAQTPPDVPVRLSGHVLAALQQATRAPAAARANAAIDEPLTLTVVLNRSNEPGFQNLLAEIENPLSPNFQHFLSQDELTKRFGPSQQAYDAVLAWLQGQGFSLTEGSSNRLTLTVQGTRAQAEKAFTVQIGDYQLGGRSFYANTQDPAVPAAVAPHIQAVVGLANLALPQARQPQIPVRDAINKSLCYLFSYSFLAYNTVQARVYTQEEKDANYQKCLQEHNIKGASPGIASASAVSGTLAPDGSGQKIGLLEYDTFQLSDVGAYLSYAGLPATLLNQVSDVKVNGGNPTAGSGEGEVLLDVDAALTIAPGAGIAVYEAPSSTSYAALFNRMVTDHVTVISNSWTDCESQHSLADVQGIDSALANAALLGVSVLNGSGDTGSTCLGFSSNSIGVPSDSPHATAVGGTSLQFGPTFTYGGERWWDGSQSTPSTGQGGFGTSRFFRRPSYQNGLTNAPMRSVPDVAVDADPTSGIAICQADAGGCPTGFLSGGTSLAAPEWAAFTAIIGQAVGHPLGNLNLLFYPLATSGGFHPASSMGSDFAHVGLGSPNVDKLILALSGQTPGPVNAATSSLTAFPSQVSADPTAGGQVLVQLRDANGHTVSGKSVSLAPSAGSHAQISAPSGPSSADNGAVLFTVTDNTIEQVTFTATAGIDHLPLQQTAAVSFVSPPATLGGITASPPSVAADGHSSSTIAVTLQNAQRQAAAGKMITLSQGNGHSIVAATGTPAGVTDSTGTARFTVTDTTTEQVTYTAVDVTDSNLPVPSAATVSFTNGGQPACSNGTPTAGPGYAVTNFATGFLVDNFCIGPENPVFDNAGNMLVWDFYDGTLYKFGPQGGVADAGTRVNSTQVSGLPAGIAFGKDGRLYTGRYYGNDVVEIDPTTGGILREVATGIGCVGSLAIDPLGGDLFVTQPGCTSNILRITGPAGQNPVVTTYATLSGFQGQGLTFALDGTLYTLGNTTLVKIGGTNAPQPATVTTVATVPGGLDGVGVSSGQPPFFLVSRSDGTITKVDSGTSPPALSTVFSGGSRGGLTGVGPDGCFYATQSDRILKVTYADGTCPFASANAVPQLSLSPAVITPNPATGSPVTFTASLTNVTNPTGTSVRFTVTGANAQTKVVNAGSDGTASFTYTGVVAGSDAVTAGATVGSTNLSTPFTVVIWKTGLHVSFLNVNRSAKTGVSGQPVTLRANLTDISLSPPAPISSVGVFLSVDSDRCSAATDSTGNVSCSVTLDLAAGSYPLSASFVSDGQHAAATANDSFSVTVGAIPSLTRPTPAQGSVRGGTTITIGSSNVQSGATVTVGGFAAVSVPVGGDGTITATTPAHPPVGDTNGDGTVNAVDALCLLRFVAGLSETANCPTAALTTTVPVTVSNPGGGSAVTPTGFTYLNGDVNGDGQVTAVDALCILRSVAGLAATAACPSLSLPAAAGQPSSSRGATPVTPSPSSTGGAEQAAPYSASGGR